MSFLKVEPDSVASSDDVIEESDVFDIPVLSEQEYKAKVLETFTKCLNSKNTVNQVPIYYPYSPSRITTTPRSKSNFPPPYMAASFLMTSFNMNMTTAFKTISVLNSFDKRTSDRLTFTKQVI